MDWRYWITYEGIVTTVSDSELAAAAAAMDDVNNGKIPNIEIEPLDEGGKGE